MRILAKSHNLLLIETGEQNGTRWGRIGDIETKKVGVERPLLLLFAAMKWTDVDDKTLKTDVKSFSGW